MPPGGRADVPACPPVWYLGPMADAAVHPQTNSLDLQSLAADVVGQAMKAGASDAEAVVREGDEFSVTVRMGKVETLKESGSRGWDCGCFSASARARHPPAT